MAAAQLVWALAALQPYAGTPACLKCHAQYAGQTRTNHAGALRPIMQTQAAAALADRPIRERSGVEFEYQPATDGLAVTARLGRDSARAVLEWAFGSGAQGITPVGRMDGRYFEHRISFYTTTGRPGLTLGHPGRAPSSARGVLGIVQPEETIAKCFNCHASGVRKAGEFFEAGVTCERCHGPGAAHSAAPRGNKLLNAARFPAPAVVQICAECHRSPEAGRDIADPLSIRFQPVGLMASRCFRVSGKLSCLTCHDPHENARRNDGAYYSAKCRQCHDGEAEASSRCRRGTESNCLPCHMKASSPAPYLTFTDHRIR